MDRWHQADSDVDELLAPQRLRPAETRRGRHPELPAPCDARRLLPCRHAPRQSLHRSRGASGRGRFRDHGPSRHARSGASSPKSSTASSHATTSASRKCISKRATCPPHHRDRGFRAGDPRHRRAHPFARTADQISMARLLTLLFEITGALRHEDPRRNWCCCKRPWSWWRGSPASLDPRLDMWSTAEPVVRTWIEENLGPLGKRAGRGRPRLRARWRNLPSQPAARRWRGPSARWRSSRT